jgi:hypothetical protein
MKKRNAQSILEYIGVALVFTTAGILTFAAANNEMMLGLRGTYGNTTNSLIGRVLGPNDAEPWPEGWNPDTEPVPRDIEDEGYCQQLSDDSESCTSHSSSSGQEI